MSIDIELKIYATIKDEFGDITEDEYNDKLYDILHEELDHCINCMYDGQVESLLVEIGFDKAMNTYIDEYGSIQRGVTSRTLLYVCIKNELHDRLLSYEQFVDFTKEEGTD